MRHNSDYHNKSVTAVGISVLLVTSVLLTGCVTALHPYNQPLQAKLRLESPTPLQYSICVADKTDYPVAVDGRAIVDVPPLDRGCATYLFGVIKVKDSRSEDVCAIHLKRYGQTVRKLSLNDISKLPVDDEGYRLVKIK